MRTAARIALILTGTAIFVAAMAAPGAKADRGSVGGDDGGTFDAATAPQRPRQAARPDRIAYVLAREVSSIATSIARSSPAPEGANLRRGKQAQDAVALASMRHEAKSRSIDWPADCIGETFAIQQINATDGGRGRLSGSFLDASCRPESEPRPRTRRAMIGEMEQSQLQSAEPAPVVIRFEAVIRISLAGLGL